MTGSTVEVTFIGALSYTNLEQMTGTGVTVSTLEEGVPSAIDRFSSAGVFEQQRDFSGVEIFALAVSAATHNLLVADPLNKRILEWNPATEAVTTFSTGADTPGGSFSPLAVSAVAVDNYAASPNYGDVYVRDFGAVDRFNASGAYLCQITGKGEETSSASECDSSGPGVPGGFGETSAVAVDPSDGRLYVGDAGRHAIEEFEPSGAFLHEVPVSGTSPSYPAAVAVKASSGDVYVADPANGVVDVFGRVFTPNVTTEPVSGLGETGATLNGEIDPEVSVGGSPVKSCHFEWGETSEYGNTAACRDSAGDRLGTASEPITAPADVHADIGVRNPDTVYHFRLVAENEEGKEGQGRDETFTARGAAAIGGERSIARTNGATVEAQINPFGYETTCEVQFVEAALYEPAAEDPYAAGGTVPCADAIPAGFGDQTARAKLSGLAIGTAYHYRFVAHNQATSQGGTTVGADQEFSTFGIESFSIEFLKPKEGGRPGQTEPDLNPQAGGHPYEMKIELVMTSTEAENSAAGYGSPTANLRTVKVALPPGLIGNPTATPRCEAWEAKMHTCSGATEVGHLVPSFASGGGASTAPVFSLVPPAGVAAELTAQLESLGTVRIDAGVRTGSTTASRPTRSR